MMLSMIKIINCRLQKSFKENRGSTILETVISFVVLMIVLASLIAMVRFATELRMRAIESSRVQSEFNDQLYKADGDMDNVQKYNYVAKNGIDNATVFTLKLNKDKTNIEKNFKDNSVSVEDIRTSIKLPNVDAVGYVSNNPLVDSENLVAPKALVFMYHHRYYGK